MKHNARFASFDGTRIAYRVWEGKPEGTPLLLCSGVGCDDVYWLDLAPRLTESRTVITWDYPWHGDSGPPEDPDAIDVPSLAQHARGVLRDAGFDHAAVGGHSMGVQVALELYRLDPMAVGALIGIAGPYGHTVGSLYGTPVGILILKTLERIAAVQPELAGAAWRLALDPRIADPVGRGGGLIGDAPPEVMKRYFSHLSGVDFRGLMAMFAKGQEHDAGDLLGSLQVPVLLLHGTADVMTPYYLAQRMAERIPDATLVSVEGGAHTLPGDDPEKIASALDRFLRERIDTAD